MGLKTGLNKVKSDNEKLKKHASSQAISPLTERTLNGNTNEDSLKMAGGKAAQQGVANQQAKDQEAVKNGALAQAQQGEAQQRNLQAEGKSVADFRSEGVEKAQETANENAEQWSKSMAQFGSLGNRVSTAVQEEMAAGGEVAAQFEVNEEMMNEATKTLALPGNEVAARQIMDDVVNSLQTGDSAGAIQNLINNAQLFNVDTTNSAAALTSIFAALEIDPSQQQAMVSSALADGIIDPDKMDMQFLLDQGILTTDNAMIPELGLSVAEIEEMVGPDWKEMTVEQIEKELELQFDDEAERDDILRELANPNIDPTRKAELNRELQLMGASGKLESEAMAERGLDRVAKANQVVMGDKLQSVEDVLSDDKIKAVSNDLMMRLQDDPDNAEEIMAEWKRDNPGYESMGDWVRESVESLGDKETMFKDASEMVEAKNKEAAEFVNNNELFGSTGGAKDVLKALGFDTEGFGTMGNDAASNETYQALQSYKESNPDQFELFQQNLVDMDPEDLEGLNGADINTIMETLGTKEGMQEFNYLRELNNEMALMNTDSFTSVMSTILPEGHPLHDITSSPEAAQDYLSDLRKMKGLGVLSPELETFSKMMDADGDGKIDDPAAIAEQIKSMIGDGINIGNFQGDDAKELMGMMDQEVVGIDKIVSEKTLGWADEQAGLKTKYDTATTGAVKASVKTSRDEFTKGKSKKLTAFYDSFGDINTRQDADDLSGPAAKKSFFKHVKKALGKYAPTTANMGPLNDLGAAFGIEAPRLHKDISRNKKRLNKFYSDIRVAVMRMKSKEINNKMSAIKSARAETGYDPKATNPWENF